MAAKPATPAPSFAQKTSRAGNVAVVLMVALVFAGGALQHAIIARQKALLQTAMAAIQQSTLVQTVAMLVEEHEATKDDSLLPPLNQAAAGLLVNYEAIAPQLLPALQHGYMDDVANMQAHDLDGKMRSFIDKSVGYAQVPAAEDAVVIAKLAQQDIPTLWNPRVTELVEARQQEAEKLGMASLGVEGALLVMLCYLSLAVVKPAAGELLRQKEHLEHMGSTDMLTGLYNRAMFFKVVAMLISGAHRHKQKLTALAIDVDGMKKINDGHGRAAGDAAIRATAAALNEVLRDSDVMGRVGGAEFGVFLPSTDEYRAAFVAEKLRAVIENLPFSIKSGNILLRVSIGVGEMQPHHKTPDDVLRVAELALTHAKENGRNCVSVYSTVMSAPVAAAAAPAAPQTSPAPPKESTGT